MTIIIIKGVSFPDLLLVRGIQGGKCPPPLNVDHLYLLVITVLLMSSLNDSPKYIRTGNGTLISTRSQKPDIKFGSNKKMQLILVT